MATETQRVDAAEVYRSIRRLEGEVSQLTAWLERIDQRLDRLTFVLFAFGGTMGAALAAILAKLFLRC